jgi:hypothetical protein
MKIIKELKRIRNYTVFLLRLICKKKKGKQYFVTKLIVAIMRIFAPLVLMIIPGLLINELTAEKRISYIYLEFYKYVI